MVEVTYIELPDRGHIVGRDETGYLLMIDKNPCGSHSSVPRAFRAWCALFITPRRSWEIGCPGCYRTGGGETDTATQRGRWF